MATGIALIQQNMLYLIICVVIGVSIFIYFLPYVLILPIIATDKKLKLSEFRSNLKGFRLTFFIQTLFLFLIIVIIVFAPLLIDYNIYLKPTVSQNIFLLIFEIITFSYTINLITETFKFWNEKYNVYNFIKE